MTDPKHGFRYALAVGALVVLALLMMDFNSRMAELHRLTADRADAASQLAAQKATQAGLQTQMAYANSDAAVSRWAYEDGHMAKPGDHIVVPLQSTAVTPTPAPQITPPATQVSYWQQWYFLFFGPRAGDGGPGNAQIAP